MPIPDSVGETVKAKRGGGGCQEAVEGRMLWDSAPPSWGGSLDADVIAKMRLLLPTSPQFLTAGC